MLELRPQVIVRYLLALLAAPLIPLTYVVLNEYFVTQDGQLLEARILLFLDSLLLISLPQLRQL